MIVKEILIVFFALCAAGSVISLLTKKAHLVISIFGSLASVSLVATGILGLGLGKPLNWSQWSFPIFGQMHFHIDGITSILLLLTGVVALPVSIFSNGYLQRYLGKYSLRSFGVMYHLLLASIAAVFVTWDVMSFLVSWEAMSVLSYLCVNFEHRHEENTHAGLLMLVMGEVGTLAIAISMFILGSAGGGLDFESLRLGAQELGPGASWAVFLLSFFGFGVKAGIVPVNTWLPRAHPAAPANISALLSGVILNLGLYGIIRMNLDLAPVVSVNQGLVVVITGSITALVGILYATIDNDMKRMLAHSSIENIGIITAVFGAGLVFSASSDPTLAGLAFIAAFYHLINHSIYKALLFLGAGSVDARSGTRDMNRLGGLIKIMPWTSLMFLIGAMSIAALPPLNGFVSEWLALQTFLQSATLSSTSSTLVRVTFVLCGAALALTAALAVTCFVKAFAMSFLGKARSAQARSAKPAGGTTRLSMGILALTCIALGLLPTYVIPKLDESVNVPRQRHAVESLVPAFFRPQDANPIMDKAFVDEFHDLGAQVGKGLLPGRGLVVLHRGQARNPVVFAMSTSYTVIVLGLLLAMVFLLVHLFTRKRTQKTRAVWAGGLENLPPELTYTATGFSNPVRVVFNTVFRPQKTETRHQNVARHFRSAVSKQWEVVHLADRWVTGPIVHVLDKLAHLAASMHSGRINAYAAYMLMALVLVLLAGHLFT